MRLIAVAEASLYDFPHSSPEATPNQGADVGIKVSQEEANYRDAGSSRTRCGTCAHFQPGEAGGGTCDVVAGNISPGGLSDLWTRGNDSLTDLIGPA